MMQPLERRRDSVAVLLGAASRADEREQSTHGAVILSRVRSECGRPKQPAASIIRGHHDQGATMTSQPAESVAAQASGTRSTQAHDPEYPAALLDFMRTGWSDSALTVTPSPAVPNYAARRAAVSAAFAGLTVVVPSGVEKVRSNDTVYLFRPGTDLFYLTGEHDPEAVLVLHPSGTAGHDATLYVRPRSPRDSDEFFRDRAYGELWIGRRHTLEEKSDELGIATARGAVRREPRFNDPTEIADVRPAFDRRRGFDAALREERAHLACISERLRLGLAQREEPFRCDVERRDGHDGHHAHDAAGEEPHVVPKAR